MAISAPVRNRPPQSDRHKCNMVAEVDGEVIDLTNESALRDAGIENGSIFTCDEPVEVNGVAQSCGKQWVLHYPTKFAWKPRRTAAASTDSNGAANGATESAQTPEEIGGKRKKH